MSGRYVIGLDYGTNSVRSLVVDVTNGRELSSSVEVTVSWSWDWVVVIGPP